MSLLHQESILSDLHSIPGGRAPLRCRYDLRGSIAWRLRRSLNFCRRNSPATFTPFHSTRQQGAGNVVAIAPLALDRMAWCQRPTRFVEELASEQAAHWCPSRGRAPHEHGAVHLSCPTPHAL